MNSPSKIIATEDLSMYTNLGIRTRTDNFTNWHKSGLFSHIDENFIKDIQQYWMKHFGKEIDPYLHIASMNLTGEKDLRFIPQRIMHREILPVFNDYDKSLFYGDKNLYAIVIDPPRSVEAVLRNINSQYFDTNHVSIDYEKACDILSNVDRDLIIKPSQTNNGTEIRKLSIIDKQIYLNDKIVSLKDLEEIYEENFIIQKALEQHPNMAAPHPNSINTLRMVTFRWKNEVRYLLTFVRFGSNNDIKDNGGDGNSPRLGVTDTGEFYQVGISQNGEKFTHHPTTGFCFADLKPIPNFDEYKQFVIDCHKKILHLNIASWDIVVGVDGKPIFLEVNFAGLTSFYQLVTQRPIFGDLTDEVLAYARKRLEKKEPVLMYRHRRRIAEREARKKDRQIEKNRKTIEELEKKNKKLIRQRRQLRKKINEQSEKQIRLNDQHKEKFKKLQQKYNKIKNSKSYRYTRPLRKIFKWFK